MRTPNLKKSLKARTTGRLKRAVKRTYNPLYGKKGIGLAINPKKSIYNKVYQKVTFDSLEEIKKNTIDKKRNEKSTADYNKLNLNNHHNEQQNDKYPTKKDLLKSVPKEKQVKYFDKEAHCCICNKDLGLMTLRSRWQLIDGWLCIDCLKLAGGFKLKRRGDTVNTIKERIKNNLDK